MVKLKQWFKDEFLSGYSAFEVAFLIAMLLLQVIVYCFAPDSLIGMICGVSGVICVVLTAKAKISSYIFNFIQIVTYMIICWSLKLYLEFAENIFYFVTCIFGVLLWKKNMVKKADGTKELATKKFKAYHWVITALVSVAGTAALGFVGERYLGSTLPYYDAFTNVLSIVAQMLMVWRFREQWAVWILIDLTCLVMFTILGQWSMVAMYVAWTINAIYGWYNWTKLSNKTDC